MLLQPLGHLSVFRINNLRAAQTRLSLTPDNLPSADAITCAFSGLKRTEDVAKVGDIIWVKCIGIDDKGRVKLSRKAALKERAEAETGQPAPTETH